MTSMRSSSDADGSVVSTSSVMISRTVLFTTVPSWWRLPDDVPLADDAVEGLSVPADDQRADVVLGQEREELAYAGVGSDRDDGRVGLGLEDLGDAHVADGSPRAACR